MTVTAHPGALARAGSATHRIHRRLSVVVGRGTQGVVRVTSVLGAVSDQLRDLAADVHEGVQVSEVICTVAVTPDEADDLRARLEEVADVLAVDEC